MKEEALDRTMWRARFGRGFGPVVRQTAKGMNMCTEQLPTGGYPIAIKYKYIIFPLWTFVDCSRVNFTFTFTLRDIRGYDISEWFLLLNLYSLVTV